MRRIVFLLCFFFVAQLSAQQQDKKQAYLAELKVIGRTFSDSFYPKYAQIYALQDIDFIAKVDSARTTFNALLNRYRQVLDTAYFQEQQLEIKYYFDKLLIDYPVNHAIYSGKTSGKDAKILSRLSGNMADFNRPDMLVNTDFINYVKAFFSYQLSEELKKPRYKNTDNQYLQAIWQLIPRYLTNQQCRDFWQADYLYSHIDNNGIKNIESIYTRFTSTCKDTTLLNKITAIYNEDKKGRQGHEIKTYKTIGNIDLDMHVFLPEKAGQGPKRPVIIYFHGGSWSEGKPDWFFNACETYAKNGWVACAVEYRTYGRQRTLPFEAVKDARSAIRWLRQHADEMNIDPNKIVASGNSAGGHLVLSTALADKWNEKTDNLAFSPVPNALMVNAGVYDLTDQTTAWIRKDLKAKDLVKEISPNYLIKANLPPTLIIHGTADQNVPFATAQKFVEQSQKAGNRNLEFYPLEKAGHFIWYDPKYSPEVAKFSKDFMAKLGY